MLQNLIYKSDSIESTKKIAEFFAKKFLKKNDKIVIFLEGDLGSGKTTFVRYVLNCLGISDSKFEGSPTFTIVNEYKNNIFHIDLYRLKNEEDIENIGIGESLDRNGIFFIEWPGLLKIKANICIKFEAINLNKRKIIIDKF